MMFTGIATVRPRGTSGRLPRLTAAACACTLAVLLTGNVAAVPLEREDRANAPLVTPRFNTPMVSHWTMAKLATTAGYNVLVFG